MRHSWTNDLKRLVLTGRNANPLFTLPGNDAGIVLDRVEELTMIDCGITESTRVQIDGMERQEGTFALIARLFPSMRILDLSYNQLPCLAGIREVLLRRDNAERKGVRELKLKGCGVNNLDELVAILEDSGAEPAGSDLALRELDLSDNEISKLPPKLGLLPVDVLLVDGNLFRIPARRVWEKEGERTLCQKLARVAPPPVCALPIADWLCPPAAAIATYSHWLMLERSMRLWPWATIWASARMATCHSANTLDSFLRRVAYRIWPRPLT
ncbi:hypothetical protein CALCODRAFT_67747 [Calocera cornea HHB12733]|uniref:L domain-like protein n=1 Tax=Calocera cornea HHB12733 TaxID=1353952 RepID=A0A165DJA6_9BASI|nr:hypothetical protein CALCODRAFT_67747 [Calocera cornea HHB12733]